MNQQLDIAVIKEQMRQLQPAIEKINDIHTLVTQEEGKVKVLNKAIFGNGKPGLIDKVDNMRVTMAYYAGAASLFGGLVTLVITIFIK